MVDHGRTMEGKNIYLDNDIYLNDVSDYENWKTSAPKNRFDPIGDDKTKFSGTLNGQNNTIYGLYVYSYSEVGLIYDVDTNAEISNIILENSYVEGKVSIGSICSYNYGAVNNCTVNGTVSCRGSSDYHVISGGICGRNSGKIANCSFYGMVSCSAAYSSNQSNSIYSGGICGYGENYSKIKGCNVNGAITSSSNVADSIFSSTSTRSYSGGIVGYTLGEITECGVKGSIVSSAYGSNSGYGYSYAGGICGRSNSKIKNCYNQSKIESKGSIKCSGGICGDYNSLTVKNAYNSGVVNGGYGGGILGSAGSSTLINCYYLNTTAANGVGDDSSNKSAISKSEANMKTEAFAKSLGNSFMYVEGDYPKIIPSIIDTVVMELNEYNQSVELEIDEDIQGTPTWISDDPSVATVKDGVVTAVGNGECTVYVICGDIRNECKVTVNFDYSLSDDSLELYEEDVKEISVISASTNEKAEGFDIKWTSSDDTIAIVENGVITAKSAGTATITAEFGNINLKCNIKVVAVEPILPCFNKSELEIDPNDSFKLQINNYSGSAVWVSDNPTAVTVKDGTVNAIKSGMANVYATLSDGTVLRCKVTVKGGAVTTTAKPVTKPTTTTAVKPVKNDGDLNNDGTVSVSDIVILQEFLVNKSNKIINSADLNNDGGVNVFDLVILKRSVLTGVPLGAWNGTVDTSWYDSDETEIHISNEKEYAELVEILNGGRTLSAESVIYLENDLDFGGRTLQPIKSLNFVLDGQNNTISGLSDSFVTVNSGSISNLKVSGAKKSFVVTNLGNINNVTVDASLTSLSSDNVSGIICSLNKGKISECTSNGSISVTAKNTSKIGGICSYQENGSILNSNFNGTIDVVGSSQMTGGICGYQKNGCISNCESNAVITSDVTDNSSESSIGGICGYSESSYIDNCKSFGNSITANGNVEKGYVATYGTDIKGTDIIDRNVEYCDVYMYYYYDSYYTVSKIDTKIYVGGICGNSIDSAVTNSENISSINGKNSMDYNESKPKLKTEGDNKYEINKYNKYIMYTPKYTYNPALDESLLYTTKSDVYFTYSGGICGKSNYTIVNCKNTGSVNNGSRFSNYEGGICGYLDGTASLNTCCNYGDINGYSGGICGYSGNAVISDSYNMGTAEGGICYEADKTSIERVYNTGKANYGIVYSGTLSEHESCFYLNSSAANGISPDVSSKDNTIAKSDANMKKEDFAEKLGEKFVYINNNYPKLTWEVIS